MWELQSSLQPLHLCVSEQQQVRLRYCLPVKTPFHLKCEYLFIYLFGEYKFETIKLYLGLMLNVHLFNYPCKVVVIPFYLRFHLITRCLAEQIIISDSFLPYAYKLLILITTFFICCATRYVQFHVINTTILKIYSIATNIHFLV